MSKLKRKIAIERSMPVKPVRSDKDHEFYFTARFHCPNCSYSLGSYQYGRASMIQNKEIFVAKTDKQCLCCGQAIDWNE
jgi:hypothetical protein